MKGKFTDRMVISVSGEELKLLKSYIDERTTMLGLDTHDWYVGVGRGKSNPHFKKQVAANTFAVKTVKVSKTGKDDKHRKFKFSRTYQIGSP